MTKQTALEILQSIRKDLCENWNIPHRYKSCNKEVILSNGEKVNLLVEDEVYDFLAYIKELIEKEEDKTNG